MWSRRLDLSRTRLAPIGWVIGLLLCLIFGDPALAESTEDNTGKSSAPMSNSGLAEISEWAFLAGGLLIAALILCAFMAHRFVQCQRLRRKDARDQSRLTDLLNRTGQMAKVGGWEYDVVRDRLLWTNEVYRIYELPPGSAIDVTTGVDFYAPEARPILRAAFQAGLETGEGWDLELPFVTARGRALWVRAIGEAERQDGKTIRLFGTFADITASKRLESELRQSEQRFRDICETVSDFIWEVDTEARYIFLSRNVGRIMGCSAEQLIGTSPFDRVVDPPRDELAELFQSAVDRAVPIKEQETWQRTRDGRIVCLLTNGVPMIDGNGNVVGFRGLDKDITGRKQAEADLRRSEDRTRLVLEATNDGIWDWRIKTGELYLSPKWKAMLGYTDTELAPNIATFSENLHPDDRDRVMQQIRQTIRQRERTSQAEYRMRHKNGSWRYILARGVLLADTSGVPYRMIGSHTDLTEHIRAAEQIKDLSDSVSLATRAAHLGIWDLDVKTGRLHWNDEMFAIYGIAPADFRASIQDWQERLHPDDRDKAIALAEVAFDRHDEYNTEFRIVRPDGAIRVIRARAMIRRTASGTAVRAIGVNWDVTKDRTALEELRTAKEQAEAANIAKSRFLASMSHELRTPLNAILGFTDLMLAGETNAKRREFLEIIGGAGRNLLELIQTILDLSRAESGRIKIDKKNVALAPHLEAVFDLFRAEARHKGILLTKKIAADTPEVARCDPELLRQILVNLIGNAVKFTERGAVTVHLSLDRDGSNGSHLLYRVSDTGIGIAKDNQQRIFRIFEQEDDVLTRRHGGAGLGLAIARNLVSMLDGEISVVSTPGVGSCFSFTAAIEDSANWPGKDEARQDETNDATGDDDKTAGPVPPPLPGSELANTEVPIGPARILVVDDDAMNLRLVRALLADQDFDLTFAEDGVEACDLLSQKHFDLILLDIQMPNMDGIEVTKHIRAGKLANCDPTIPVIALTAFAMPGDQDRFLACGVSDYLSKPLEPLTLLKRVQMHLSGSGRGAEVTPTDPRPPHRLVSGSIDAPL